MKKFLIIFIAIFFCTYCYSQNLIGYDVKSIRKYMKENCGNMSFEKVTNPRFSYLKYSDNSDLQTLLFFLGRDSICRSQRMILDPAARGERIKEFNSRYKKKSENSWIDNHGGKNYLVELHDETYNTIVTIIPEK